MHIDKYLYINHELIFFHKSVNDEILQSFKQAYI